MCGAGGAACLWRRAVAWVWGAVVLAHLVTPATAGLLDTNPGLAYNFYRTSCPNAEAIVKSVVSAQVAANPALAGRLLRLHFHDCFVQVRQLCVNLLALFLLTAGPAGVLCSDSSLDCSARVHFRPAGGECFFSPAGKKLTADSVSSYRH